MLQHLSIRVVGGRITQEQVTVGDTLFHSDTYAEAVGIWIKHGLEMSGRAHPILHRSLWDI